MAGAGATVRRGLASGGRNGANGGICRAGFPDGAPCGELVRAARRGIAGKGNNVKIATISSPERGETDRLISDAAAFLQAGGARLAGIVKVPEAAQDAACACDTQVLVLPDGPVIAITQDLGEGSDACRLDPGAIARAVGEVERRSLDGVQLFVLNKFGPEEADGRGFRDAIGAALAAGIPVLVGVAGPRRAAFDAFAGGLAEDLPPEPAAIRAWCETAMS